MRINVILFTLFVYLIASCKSARDEVTTEEKGNLTLLDIFQNLETQFKTFTNAGMKKLFPSIPENLRTVNLSKECRENSLHLISGLRDIKAWAMQFIDSSGKFPDGLMTGSFSAFGAYDECLNIKVKSARSKDTENILFSGQYCTIDIKIRHLETSNMLIHSLDELKNFSQKDTIVAEMAKKVHYLRRYGVKLGLCTPSGCSTNDIDKILDIICDGHPIQASALRCEKKEENKYTPKAIGVIIYCCFLVVLVLVGSAIDIYSNYSKIIFKSNVIRVLLAFSLYNNFEKFCSTAQESNSLSCLYGIKFLGMTWVIAGHTMMMMLRRMTHGVVSLYSKKDNFSVQVYINGFPSVDTFFLIGGFLVSYLVIRYCKVEKHEFSIWHSIVHRLWRFLPAYSFIIIFLSLIPMLGSGPLWHELVMDKAINCQKNWWKNLLFITNFFPSINMCLPHAWYVTADFQLYLFSILILLCMIRCPKIGFSLSVLTVIASIVSSGVITYVNNFPPTSLYYALKDAEQTYNYFDKLYFQPINHAAPYAIGLMLGYIVATKPDLKIPLSMQIFGWTIAFIMSFSAVYGIYAWHEHPWHEQHMYAPLTSTIMYASFSKTSYALGVAWLILCCVTKHGGIINYILSWKVFMPLSRLTFLAYLIHLLQMNVFFGNIKTQLPPDAFFIIFLFFGHLCVSYILAFVVHMLVEVPFMNLERIVLPRRKKHEEKVNIGKENNAFDAELQLENTDKTMTLSTIRNGQSIKN